MQSPSPVSMQALQRADKLLGWLACLALQPWRWTRRLRLRLAARERAPRVLLIKFWGIGSLQLLTPAVSQVRQRHAGSEFVLLTLAGNAEFARGLGTFDRVLTLDVDGPSWPRMFGRICRLIMSLRRERFETVYDFEFFTRFSAVVSTLTGAPVTRGFEAPSVWRGGLHSQAVPFNRYWHVARNFRVLAGDSGLEDVMPADFAPLAFSAQDAARVDALLSEHGIGAGVDFAVLNPNAGKLSLERRWPKEHFAALAGSLERTQQLPAVLIGSSAEQAYTQQALLLARQQGAQAVLNLAGRLSTAELAALFSRASVLVTNDSGPMHIAAALGTPTLGLFGPETPVMYRPVGWNVRSLYRPPPCSPCINVHDNKLASCVWGRPECLMNLEVEEVLRETQALLKGSSVELRPVRRAARAAGAEGSRKADERPHRGQGPSD